MKEFTSITIIEEFKLFLVYYSEYSLLLYKKCKFAIFKNSLNKHIKKHLDDFEIRSLFYKEIVDFFNCYNISTLESIYKRLQSIEKVKLFSKLDIINTAFLCTLCNSILLSKKKSQVYYKSAYNLSYNSLIKENISI